MKNFSVVLTLVLVLSGVVVTSCSSKETRSEEPVVTGSADASAKPEAANLGSASSGQGR